MKSYLSGIVTLVVLSSAVEMLLPEKRDGTAKYVRLLLSVLLTFALLSPVIALFGDLPAAKEKIGNEIEKIFDAVPEKREQIFRSSRLETEDGIADAVAEAFSLRRENVSVTMRLDCDGYFAIQGVIVTLYGDAITCSAEAIRAYLTPLLGVDVEVLKH